VTEPATLSAPGPDADFPVRLGDIVMMVLAAGLLVLGGIALIGTVAKPAESGSIPELTALVLLLEAIAIGAAVYLFGVRRRRLGWAAIGLRPVTGSQIRRAVIVGLFTFLFVTGGLGLLQVAGGDSVDNPQMALIAGGEFSWLRAAMMLALGGALVPFAEELFFRGVLYRWLRKRWGVAASALVSAAIFGLAHAFFVLVALGAFMVGIVLAVVYERTGSLWPAAVVHGVFNSASLMMMFAGQLVAAAP